MASPSPMFVLNYDGDHPVLSLFVLHRYFEAHNLPFPGAFQELVPTQDAYSGKQEPHDFVELKMVTGAMRTLQGELTVLRYLTRNLLPTLYAPINDVFVFSEVDQWLDFAFMSIGGDSPQPSESALKDLNEHLQLRSYLIGHSLTIADIVVWSHLTEKLQVASAKTVLKAFPHVLRYVSFLSAQDSFKNGLSDWTKVKSENAKTGAKKPSGKGAAAGNAKQPAGKKSKLMGAVGGLDKIKLKNPAKGKVVTRFPPEPSGYMHIGHAKAALLNSMIASKYDGTFLLRFDDTNPQKEKTEFADAILSDLKSLGVKHHKLTHTSDYFDEILNLATKMIKEGKFYADKSTGDEIAAQRMKGEPSPFRANSVEENLRIWGEMQKFSEEGRQYVLRAKIDFKHKKGCMRDPNMFRCLDATHPRPQIGNKYKVYPLYDFACPVVDAIEGVTHALRSSEYHDRNPLYEWVVNAVNLPNKPNIEDFSRLNFGYTLMSKRKLQWFVDTKKVPNWNDPRFPTVQGLLRRGLTVDALREFIVAQGASKNQNLMEIEKLWAVNRKMIDPIVPRFRAMDATNSFVLTLKDFVDTVSHKTVLRHKKNESLGTKVITFSKRLYIEGADAALIKPNEEVTLMDWGNAIIESIDADKKTMIGRLHLEGSVKSTEKKLTWLSLDDDTVEVVLHEYGHLITKAKVEKDDNVADIVNPQSEFITKAIGDSNLRSLAKGDKMQLERRGYFICDEPFVNNTKPIHLIMIPDGHTAKAASVVSSANKATQKKK